MNALLAIPAVVLVGAALSWAAPVAAPAAFALFAVALAAPVRDATARHLGGAAGLLAAVAACVLVVGVLALTAAWAFARVAGWAAANAGLLHAILAQQAQWLEARGLPGMDALAPDTRALLRAAQSVAGQARELLTFAVVTLVFVLLFLGEARLVARQLEAWGTPAALAVLRAAADAALKLRRYMLVRTVMSALTGLAVYGFARLAGLELATEWGVIAFVLNYVPFLGSLVATALPTAVAALQFGTWQAALLVFVAIQGIQFAIGSWLEPVVAGRRLSLSPSLTLGSVFLGALLWGVPGAFIGVPALILAVSMCERFERTRLAARLMSGRPPG